MKLKFEDFAPRFHESWHRLIKPVIESEEMENIYKVLRAEKRVIVPKKEQTFRAFEINLEEMKAILVGMLCPYHTKGRADGLLFSCADGQVSPSLEKIYDAMEDDLGYKVERIPDWTYIKLQDVLLLNSSLTTVEGIAGEHVELWQPFMKLLFTQVLDVYSHVPVVIFGKDAEYIEQFLHRSIDRLKVSHPAFYARKKMPMEHKHLFTWINDRIEEVEGEGIIWDNAKYETPF